MTQKFNADKISTEGSPEGYVLRVSDSGVPEWESVLFGTGSIDSIQARQLNELAWFDITRESDLLPAVDSGVNIGSRVRPFTSISLSDAIFLGSTQIRDSNGTVIFTNANGKEFRIGDFDSQALINLIDSQFVSSIIGDATGPQGVQGIQGARGSQGIQGLALDGPRGTIGIQGPTGPDGPQGLQGAQGLQGVNGTIGLQGLQGIQGLQGLEGNQGVQGLQGFGGLVPDPLQGISGCPGLQGIQGPDGIGGTQGPQGIRGSRGPQGVQGIYGIQGDSGIQGAVGAQGIRGPEGNDFTEIQGVQGIQGDPGVQGIQGNQGSSLQPLRCLEEFDDAVGCFNTVTDGDIGIGCWALQHGNFASSNVALGPRAANIETTIGSTALCWCYNVAIGTCALNASDLMSGLCIENNVAIGFQALSNMTSNTSVGNNVAIGHKALSNLSNPSTVRSRQFFNNVSIGDESGQYRCCACYVNNVFIGRRAGNIYGPTTIDPYGVFASVIIGEYGSTTYLENNMSCSVWLGGDANADGDINCVVSVGYGHRLYETLRSVAIGKGSILCCINGGVAVGENAAAWGCSFSVAQNITSIGKNAGCARQMTGTGVIAIGINSKPSSAAANRELTLGNANHTVIRSAVQTITALSDCRDKTCIGELPYGIDFIKGMRPVEFNWNRRKEVLNGLEEDIFAGKPDLGFLAQELQKLEEEFCSKQYTRMVFDVNPDRLEATAHRSYPIVIKAIQDLSKQIDRIKTKLENGAIN